MTRPLRIALSMSLVCIPLAVLAQGPAAGAADMKEMAAYRLTIPTLNKVLLGTKNLVAAAKSNPRLSSILGNSQSLSAMAGAIEKEPAAVKALAGAGIGAREYAKFMIAYAQAGNVVEALKQGVISEIPPQLAASMNVENIKFFQEHETEITAFQNTMDSFEVP